MQKLRDFSNKIFISFVSPFGMLVPTSFWAIYFIDRSLIYPKILDTIIPSWENHILHTLPLIAALIQSFISKHKYPSFITGVLYSAILIVGYIIWLFFI